MFGGRQKVVALSPGQWMKPGRIEGDVFLQHDSRGPHGASAVGPVLVMNIYNLSCLLLHTVQCQRSVMPS